MPEISVIVPAYNVEKYVGDTLESLISQSFTDFEVIAVNDGSQDSTKAVIDDFCKKDNRISCISQQNAGVSAARNTGLAQASGKYIVFLDSDDLLAPDSLMSFYTAMESTDADMAVGRIQNFGSAGEKFNPFADAMSRSVLINPFDKALLWNFLLGNKCFRRERIAERNLQFPKLRYSEDGVFIASYMLPDAKIVGAGEALMRYRRHEPDADASVTQRVSSELVEDYIEAMRRIYACAEDALKTVRTGIDAHSYMQEIIFKADYALIAQFYRLFWQADDSTLLLIGREHERLQSLMDDEVRKRDEALTADIGKLKFTKRELAENPVVSVIFDGITGDALSRTVNCVLRQSMPCVELIIRESAARANEGMEWLDNENLRVLPDSGFKKAAKKAAKSEKILLLDREQKLDSRLFKFIINLGVPEKIKNICFTSLCKAGQAAIEMKKI